MNKTHLLVNWLLSKGLTKWYIKKIVGTSFRSVDAWSKAEWQARKNHLVKLEILYDEKCKELEIGLYARKNNSYQQPQNIAQS